MQNVRCGSQAVIPRFRMAERTGAGTLLTAGTLLPNHVIIVTYRFRKCNCKNPARFSLALAGPLTLMECFSCLMGSLEFSPNHTYLMSTLMSKNAVCALSFMLILMICLLLLICHDEINVQNVPIRILSLSVEGMEYYVYQTTLSQTVFGGRLSKNHAQTRSSGVSESRFEVQYISVSRSQNHRPVSGISKLGIAG